MPLSNEVRAAVMADLLMGKSYRATARAHGVGESYCNKVSKEITALARAQVKRENQRDFGDMLGGLLEKRIRAEEKILEEIQDPIWIKDQNASSLADLLGAIADRTMELIITANRAGALGHGGRSDGGASPTDSPLRTTLVAGEISEFDTGVGVSMADGMLVDE